MNNSFNYENLNLKRIKALYERAKSLFNGKYEYMGGDYWCKNQEDDKELKAYKLIALLYAEIYPCKNDIIQELQEYEIEHPNALYRCGEKYEMLLDLTGIIKWYEDEVQYILDTETDESNNCFPSKELLDFIIFKKRDEFSLLFQTIIDNHIDDGLDRAAITYILYSSSMFNSKKYHEWNPFYRLFCKDIGWGITAYKPNRLTDTVKDLKSRFFWVDAIK